MEQNKKLEEMRELIVDELYDCDRFNGIDTCAYCKIKGEQGECILAEKIAERLNEAGYSKFVRMECVKREDFDKVVEENKNLKQCSNKEIFELFEFCIQNNVDVSIKSLFGGNIIKFNNGDDIIQHKYSYGSDSGFLEFSCFDDDISYKPIDIDQAKSFILLNKNILNNIK